MQEEEEDARSSEAKRDPIPNVAERLLSSLAPKINILNEKFLFFVQIVYSLSLYKCFKIRCK